MKQTYKEAVKYGIVGVTGLGIDWIFFFIFRDVFGIPYWVSHILSSAIAILNNFILNRRFTFKATDKIVKRGISFFAVAGVGLLMSSILLPWSVRIYNIYLHEFLNIESQKVVQNIAKLLVTLFIAGLQFFANKYLTFKQAKS